MGEKEQEEKEQNFALTPTLRFTEMFDSILKSDSSSNTAIIVAIAILAIMFIAIGLSATRPFAPTYASKPSAAAASAPAPSSATSSATATVFTCAGGSSISATFYNSSVQLSLSDGRHVILPRALSGSGARYANPDGSFVFWDKGNTAFITENGQTTYDGCVTNG